MSKNIKSAEKYKFYRYSYSFKKQIMEELENGQLSINQASKKYNISRSTIQKWFTRMGNTEKRMRSLQGMSPMQKLRALTVQVKRLEQEKEILSFAMELISEEVGTDMLKKYLPESQEVIKKRRKRS